MNPNTIRQTLLKFKLSRFRKLLITQMVFIEVILLRAHAILMLHAK